MEVRAGCGANSRNLFAAGAGVRVIHEDIANAADFAAEIRGCHVIFNLAGEISHIHSMQRPGRDAEINALAQLRFLEACSHAEPGVRVVFASTRQIYGVPEYLPVDETHPIRPVDFNGIHKYAATAYHQIFSSQGRLDARVLCLTNVYGPRMALDIPGQGFLGNFLRQAILGEAISVFGDGSQVRDPVFVDDVVQAFLLAGTARNPKSRLWNLGGRALTLAGIAKMTSAAASAPAPVFQPFPEFHKRIDIGSYRSDSRRIQEELGWQPHVDFQCGIRRSLEYYRAELPFYLDPADYRLPATADTVAV